MAVNTDLCSIFLAVINSTIRYFCDVFDVILFASVDALRRSARRRIAKASASGRVAVVYGSANERHSPS